MKTFPLCFLLFLVPVVLKAQRVQIGFDAGPTVAHRFMRSDSEALRRIFADERAMIRYNVGVDVGLRVGANGQLGMGLLYAPRGYGQHFQMTDENGAPLPKDLKILYHFDYLDVPVWGKYRFGVRERQSFYALAGFNNSFFLRNTTVVRNSPVPLPDDPKLTLPRYTPGVLLGLGMRRAVSDKFSVEAGPQATLQLENLFGDNYPVKRFLYTAGLNFRVAYDL